MELPVRLRRPMLRALERVRPSARLDSSPIVVGGAGHSGTTVLMRCLANHPAVLGLSREISIFEQFPSRQLLRGFDLAAVSATESMGRKRYCHKNPTNVHHVGRILRDFPFADVVLIERDGRDVVASTQRRFGLESSVSRWINAVEATMRWEGNPRVHLIRYEHFVKDPEGELTVLCGKLGLHFSSNMLEVPEQWRWHPRHLDDHGRNRAAQVSQGIFDGTGQWTELLSDEDQAYVSERLGRLLAQRGYL